MAQRIMRIRDDESVHPLRRNRFFLVDLTITTQGATGRILFWPGQDKPHERAWNSLLELPPHMEAAAFFMLRGSTDASRARRPLTAAGSRLKRVLERADGLLPALLAASANKNIRVYDDAASLLERLREPQSIETAERVRALWDDAMAKAQSLTRVENNIFGLGEEV